MKTISETLSHDKETTVPRFIMLSSHDTTLAAILICLEAAREIRWPEFSTTLVFELFSRQEDPTEYYVRILWNEEIVSLIVDNVYQELCDRKRDEQLAAVESDVYYGVDSCTWKNISTDETVLPIICYRISEGCNRDPKEQI